MQITIFGASGKVGRQVVALALANGHQVTAFVHSRNPFEENTNLKVVMGDVNDDVAVKAALQGSQAVISSLGSWHTKTKSVLGDAMQTIIPIMKEQGIQRIITVTGAGALWTGDSPGFLDKAVHGLLGLTAPKILRDGEEHIRLLAGSDLDWTCVRSPVMTTNKRETYRLTNKLAPLWALIPRAAVAHCLVDQLESIEQLRQAPTIRSHA